MSRQWWSSPSAFVAQAGCLLALFTWSVHHAPAETKKVAPVAPAHMVATEPAPRPAESAVDHSEETASNVTIRASDPRFVAPPTVRFRTEHPPAGSLNLRPLERERVVPWQPVHPQNPPQRLPSGPRSPFEISGSGATVYNAPPLDTE